MIEEEERAAGGQASRAKEPRGAPRHDQPRPADAPLLQILDCLPDALWLVEVDSADEYRFLHVNAAFAAVTGLSRERVVGLCLHDWLPPQKLEAAREKYRQVVQTCAVLEYEEKPVHDAKRIALITLLPILDSAGRCYRVLGRAKDITQTKRQEDEIRELNAMLEERVLERTAQLDRTNRELSAFSYSVSHDLRAPLRGIDGFSQALLEDYADKLDDQGKEYLTRVRSETQRMGLLIDDLLKLSRVTQAEMTMEQVDMTELAKSLVARLQERAPERECEWAIELGLTALADAGLMRAALTNLLDNAWKFTSKVASARIELRSQMLNGEQVLFVRDNGAGFDMSYATKLFSPFQRLHAARDFPGNGVGLATVQRVVQRHGGRIWAESEPGKGATFYFTLGKPPCP